ncbi:MAG: VWA domain-containing protein [Vicinamibacterales bacterium]
MQCRLSLALMAVAMLVAGVTTTGRASLAAQSGQPAPTPAQPTFRAGVTLVTTDVIPRDSDGRFVSDLTKDSFTILEDGQPQSITSFALVHGGRTFNTVTAAPAAVPEGIVLPSASRPAAADTAGRVLLIFVDDLHFEPEYTPHVRRLVETLASTLLHDGDMMAMISSGPSSVEIGLTYDRKLVASAASRVRGSGLNAAEIFKLLETSQGPADVRSRAQIAFYTVYGILGELEQVQNKRKAIIYISTGYDFDPFPEGRHGRDRVMGGRSGDPALSVIDEENPYFRLPAVNADVDLYRYMRELTLSANRANASVFTVDPRGLVGVVDAGQYIDQSEWRTYIQKTQSTLRYIAEETGGFAVVNVNDFATEFKRIDAETSDYYVLGYYSTNPDPTRRVRELEVKVDRPGITVASRRAYSLKSPGKPVAPLPLPKKR